MGGGDVGGVIGMGGIFFGVFFQKRWNTGNEDKQPGNVNGTGDGYPVPAGEIGKGINKNSPPAKHFTEVVGVAGIFIQAGRYPGGGRVFEFFVLGFLKIGDGFQGQTCSPDEEAKERDQPIWGNMAG